MQYSTLHILIYKHSLSYPHQSYRVRRVTLVRFAHTLRMFATDHTFSHSSQNRLSTLAATTSPTLASRPSYQRQPSDPSSATSTEPNEVRLFKTTQPFPKQPILAEKNTSSSPNEHPSKRTPRAPFPPTMSKKRTAPSPLPNPPIPPPPSPPQTKPLSKAPHSKSTALALTLSLFVFRSPSHPIQTSSSVVLPSSIGHAMSVTRSTWS